VTSWNDEPVRTHGLSGDLGWNDSDEPPLGGRGSVLLLVASTVYFGSVWLLSGLAPLPLLASRIRWDCGVQCTASIDAVPTPKIDSGNTPA